MIRFISHLLGKPYETCKSCETLKQQLEYVNAEKKQLLDTILDIVKPKTFENPPVELNQKTSIALPFSRRRAAYEAKDREDAKILRENKFIGQPDSQIKSSSPVSTQTIEELESELGVAEETSAKE